MASDQLYITLIQPDIVWEDKEANLKQYEQFIDQITGPKEIIVMPEMFQTGFSMAADRLAEKMEGTTVNWMKAMAMKHRCVITGSLIIEDNGKYYNRLLWVQPDGTTGQYDKRHLFRYAHEDEHFDAGNKRLIARVNGWRICLLVCFDLRFPVWSRNQGDEYDILLYVANWPERRNLAWKTLLRSRAIENMSYVVGVNRTGDDGNGIHYAGESSVFGPLGELLYEVGDISASHTVTLSKEPLLSARSQFPFLNDADKFVLL